MNKIPAFEMKYSSKEIVNGVKSGQILMFHNDKQEFSYDNILFAKLDELQYGNIVQIENLEDDKIFELMSLGLCNYSNTMMVYKEVGGVKEAYVELSMKTKEMKDYILYSDFITFWKRKFFIEKISE